MKPTALQDLKVKLTLFTQLEEKINALVAVSQQRSAAPIGASPYAMPIPMPMYPTNPFMQQQQQYNIGQPLYAPPAYANSTSAPFGELIALLKSEPGVLSGDDFKAQWVRYKEGTIAKADEIRTKFELFRAASKVEEARRAQIAKAENALNQIRSSIGALNGSTYGRPGAIEAIRAAIGSIKEAYPKDSPANANLVTPYNGIDALLISGTTPPAYMHKQIDDLQAALLYRVNEEKATMIDPQRATLGGYLEYCRTDASSRPPKITPDMVVEKDAFDDVLSLSRVYTVVGEGVKSACVSVLKQLAKSLPPSPSSPIQRPGFSDDAQMALVGAEALRAAIDKTLSALPLGAVDAVNRTNAIGAVKGLIAAIDQHGSQVDRAIKSKSTASSRYEDRTKVVPLGNGSGNGNAGDWGASSAAKGAEGAGSSLAGMPAAAGFLFRKIDPIRVARYVEQIRRFQSAIDEHKVADYVEQAIGRLALAVDDLEQQAQSIARGGEGDNLSADPGRTAAVTRQLAAAKVAAAKSFVRAVRGAVASYVHAHVSFVSQRHGDAFRYVEYWQAASKETVDPESRRMLGQHSQVREDLVRGVREKLLGLVKAKVAEAASRSLMSPRAPKLEDGQQGDIDKSVDVLQEWIVRRAERVHELYIRGAPTLLDSALEPQLWTIYGLKAIRLALAWIALGIASRAFEQLYKHQVYTLDESPPHPALLVAMMLGLDAALHAIVLAVLFTAKGIFKAPDNDFPIDGALITLFGVDYALVTFAIGALALVIAAVVRSKKYFRYKYEGERGIRAMREMVFYVYCVMTPIPFYRVAHG